MLPESLSFPALYSEFPLMVEMLKASPGECVFVFLRLQQCLNYMNTFNLSQSTILNVTVYLLLFFMSLSAVQYEGLNSCSH